MLKNLQHNSFLLKFFLALMGKVVYCIYKMRDKKIKIRKTMIFTKSRPHKMKNKTLDRKLKHRKNITNEY